VRRASRSSRARSTMRPRPRQMEVVPRPRASARASRNATSPWWCATSVAPR
jgi:hypothetical protein